MQIIKIKNYLKNLNTLKKNISSGIAMTSETKISKGFQTVVPSHIRKKFDVGPGDILEWKPTEKGAEIKFRKKVTIDDIYGLCDGPKTDAVELKKKIQRGEKL